jgi:hypothetical protein
LQSVNFKGHHIDTDMSVIFFKQRWGVCQLLLLSVLLSGCAAHHGIPGHRAASAKVSGHPSQYPTLTMTVGELIEAVTPAKGLMFGGFWLGIYVEKPEIAQHLPRDGFFLEGTDILATGTGRTKAYYGNAVHLLADEVNVDDYQYGDWFWIEVQEASELKRVN